MTLNDVIKERPFDLAIRVLAAELIAVKKEVAALKEALAKETK